MNDWDRQPDESSLWYDRFLTYCLLGPQRSIRKTWRHHTTRPIPNIRSTPGGWTKIANRDHWKARARAWDEAEGAISRPAMDFKTIATSRRRIASLNDLIEDVFTLFRSLRMSEMLPHDAQMLLPVLRPLLRDLLQAEHRERKSRSPTPVAPSLT